MHGDPLTQWLHLPALDRVVGASDPPWLDAFGPGGPLTGRTPDVVFVAGLGTAGKAGEVGSGARLLRLLAAPLDPHPVRLWPVPGPGDRDADKASPLLEYACRLPLDKLFDGGDTARTLLGPFGAWNDARKQLVGTPLMKQRPWIAQPHRVGRLRLGLLGLNSAWLPEGNIVGAHVALAGAEDLRGQHRSDLIVGVLHHPPEAVWQDEQSALSELLGRCDIVLHDTALQVAKGPPIRLGVEAGTAHWIRVFADRVEVEALDMARALWPTGEQRTLPLPRRLAMAEVTRSAEGWPPDIHGLLDHLAQDWGQVLLTGLVEGDDDAPQRVDDIFVSLRVDAPKDKPQLNRRARRSGTPGADRERLKAAMEKERAAPELSAATRALVQSALKRRGHHSGPDGIEPAWRRLCTGDGSDESIETALATLDIEQAIAHNRWLLVEGDPGTGKTTTLQAVVVALIDAIADARADDRARAFGFEPPWPLPLPIYFRRFWRWLDRQPEAGQTGEDLLVEYLGHSFGGYAGGVDWIRPLLRAGRALLIFDGLDEMPRDLAQTRAVQTVRDAVSRLGDNRCLVTSRPAGLTDGVRGILTAAGMQQTRLRPLDTDQIEAFVGRWYGTLLPPETAVVEAADLVERIRAANLVELARTPITLVAMAVVHRSSRLPERRVELYEQCIKSLLHRWHQRFAEVEIRQYLGGPLGEAAKLRIVQALAHLAHRTGGDGAVLDQTPALQAVYDALPKAMREGMQGPDECAPLLETLSERSGLIVKESGRFGWRFRHRAFQEFLTGRQLCQTLAPDEFVDAIEQAIDQPDWHGVVPLAIAYQAWTASRAAADATKALLARISAREPLEGLPALAVLSRGLLDLRHYEVPWLDDAVAPYKQTWADWLEWPERSGQLLPWLAREETTRRRLVAEYMERETKRVDEGLGPTLAAVPDWGPGKQEREASQSSDVIPGWATFVEVGLLLGWLGDPRVTWTSACYPPTYVGGTIVVKSSAYLPFPDSILVSSGGYGSIPVVVPSRGRYPVAVGQIVDFLTAVDAFDSRWWVAGGRVDPSRSAALEGWQAKPSNLPVTGLTWYEAEALCRWATAHHADSVLKLDNCRLSVPDLDSYSAPGSSRFGMPDLHLSARAISRGTTDAEEPPPSKSSNSTPTERRRLRPPELDILPSTPVRLGHPDLDPLKYFYSWCVVNSNPVAHAGWAERHGVAWALDPSHRYPAVGLHCFRYPIDDDAPTDAT